MILSLPCKTVKVLKSILITMRHTISPVSFLQTWSWWIKYPLQSCEQQLTLGSLPVCYHFPLLWIPRYFLPWHSCDTWHTLFRIPVCIRSDCQVTAFLWVTSIKHTGTQCHVLLPNSTAWKGTALAGGGVLCSSVIPCTVPKQSQRWAR